MFIGIGTVANVSTVLIGGGLGLAIGHRLGDHTRRVITDALGLITILIAAIAAAEVSNRQLASYVGDSAPMLIVLGALIIGGIIGSILRVEHHLESFGGSLQSLLVNRRPAGAADSANGTLASGGDSRQRFIEGFVTASLVFCIGPLTILGSLQDGLGDGADQLFLKSALDGFAALAFAASFGLGVLASALSVAAIQGSLTILGSAIASVLPPAYLISITATGGLILLGVALRLLDLRKIAVGDLLPSLAIAPLLVAMVQIWR